MDKNKFKSILDNFLHRIDAIYSANLLFNRFYNFVGKRKSESFSEKLKKFGVEVETGKYRVPIENRRFLAKDESELNQNITMKKLLPNSVLMAFVSEYDIFIGNLLKEIYSNFPDYLKSCEREFTYAEISSYSEIDAIKQVVINKEVESVIRESHKTQLIKIANKFGLDTLSKFDNYGKFIEITQRRNIIVHCDGNISEQYINECKEAGYNTEKNIGDKISCDFPYLLDTYKILCEVSIKLFQILLRKITKDTMWLDEYILSTSYEFLKKEQYDLSELIINFGINKPVKISQEIIKKMMQINLAQCYKYQNKTADLNKIIRQDWSSCSNEIKVALEVLKENDEGVYKLMKKIGTGENAIATKISYLEWPLYKNYREKEDFRSTYKEIFGEEMFFEETEFAEQNGDDATEN